MVTGCFWTSQTCWIRSTVLGMQFHVESLLFTNRCYCAFGSSFPDSGICWSGGDAEGPGGCRCGWSSSGRPGPLHQGAQRGVGHQPVQLQQHHRACPAPWIRYRSHSQNSDLTHWVLNLHSVSSLKYTVRKFCPFELHSYEYKIWYIIKVLLGTQWRKFEPGDFYSIVIKPNFNSVHCFLSL